MRAVHNEFYFGGFGVGLEFGFSQLGLQVKGFYAILEMSSKVVDVFRGTFE